MEPDVQRLALDRDFLARAEAGRRLAPHAGGRDADALLLRLLLDHEDTWVSAETAEALFEVGDPSALAVLANGLLRADEKTFNKIGDRLRENAKWKRLRAVGEAAEEIVRTHPGLASGGDRVAGFVADTVG